MRKIKELDKIENNKNKELGKIADIAILIACVAVVLIFPFIYPIIANILMKLRFITDMDQLKEYLNMFGTYNIWLMVVVLVFLKHCFGISISEIVEKITTNIDLHLKRGESEVDIRIPIKQNKKEIDALIKESKEEAKDEIIEEKNECKFKCVECDFKNISEERESLRFFSAYQITNRFSRELLKKIVENDRIELDIFIENMNEYYMKTLKNMSKRRKKEFAEKKINELLYNLRYLDLIEYTEDDKYILVTQKGIEFVKGYAEGVG